jgi:pimeloyl-ACP methyl ester carboxylesterase/membrane-associated phospholipid phosphatase
MPEKPYSVTLKTMLLILLVSFYTAGYLGINRLNACRDHYYDVSLWFEKDIPFVPSMIIGYSFVFLLVAIMFLVIDNMPDFRDMCIRFVSMTLLCFAIFLIFPVRMDLRPEMIMTQDWVTQIVCFYFWIDRPYNLFPSMHLSASFFSAFYCLRKGNFIGIITMIMATTVGVSVILIKQHYILDVAAGFIIACFCSFFSLKWFKSRLPGSAGSKEQQDYCPTDPVNPPDSIYETSTVCVQEGVRVRVMIWRPRKPVSENPVVFVAGWVSAVSGWAPLLKVMAAGRPVYYIETREKRSALIEKRKLTPEDFSIKRMAEDLIAVCRQLGIASPALTVIGSSLGATALLEALKGKRLTAGAAFLMAPNSDFKAPWYLQWMLSLPAFLYHGIKYFILWYLKTFIVDVKKEPEQMMRYRETLLTAHPRRIKLSAMAAMKGRYQVWPHLDSVQIPVALAYAPTDTLHSSANIRLMAGRLPQAAVVVCPSNKYMHGAEIAGDIEALIRKTVQ